MDSINKKTLKAGTWYIICTFLSKGIVFLTTPVFTRVLDTQEYGITSTYNSWLSFFTVISTLDLYSCIQISRIDYEDKKEELQIVGTVTKIVPTVIDGNSHYYILLDNKNEIYDISVKENPSVILVEQGNKVTLTYTKSEGVNTNTANIKKIDN